MAKLDGLLNHAMLRNSRQFAVYVSGGVLSALVDVGTMQLLLYYGMHYAVATSTGYVAGMGVNFAFHSNVTFTTGMSRHAFARYVCVVGVNYLLTLACVATAQALLGAPMLGKMVALPLATASGFVLGKYWIFK